MNRIKSIDYVKGIAIILLLLSHCLSSGHLRAWITSFDMPIFFIICGMLNKMRTPKGLPFQKFTFWFKRRTKQIFIPYFIFGFVYIGFLGTLSFISGDSFRIKEGLFSLFSLQGIASMWFLPVYFFAELLYVFFVSKTSNIIQYLLLFCIIAFSAYLQIDGKVQVPTLFMQLIKVFISLGFVIIGGFFYNVNKKPFSHFDKLFAILSFILMSLLAIYNGPVGIGALTLGNIVIFYLVASILSYLITRFMEYIDNTVDSTNKLLMFLNLFGRNSIVVLVTNNLLIEIFRLVEYKFFDNFFLNNGIWGALLMTFILVVLEYILIQFSLRKIGFVFGKP